MQPRVHTTMITSVSLSTVHFTTVQLQSNQCEVCSLVTSEMCSMTQNRLSQEKNLKKWRIIKHVCDNFDLTKSHLRPMTSRLELKPF